jgi:hypothetical protein
LPKERSELLLQRKQAQLQWLQDTSKINADNLSSVRREDSRQLRNKKRECLKAEINELATNCTNKNIRDLHRGIHEYKNGYQPRIVKDEKDVLSHDISNTWRNFFSLLLNIHGDNEARQVEMHTAGTLIPESTPVEVETPTEDVSRYKSPGIDQILAELI